MTYYFEKAVEEAAEFHVLITFGDFIRLLSVAVRELSGIAGVWEVDEFRAEFLETEFGCKVDQCWQLKLLVHCTRTDAVILSSSINQFISQVSLFAPNIIISSSTAQLLINVPA